SAVSLEKHVTGSKDIVLCLFLLQDLDKADGVKVLRELKRVAKSKAHILLGLTVNPRRVEEPKDWKGKRVFIWNQAHFLRAISDEGFIIERGSRKNADYPRLYVTHARKRHQSNSNVDEIESGGPDCLMPRNHITRTVHTSRRDCYHLYLAV